MTLDLEQVELETTLVRPSADTGVLVGDPFGKTRRRVGDLKY